MFNIVLVTLAFISLVDIGNCQCPDGFNATFGGNCFHFSHDKETWIGAVDVCKEVFNAHLVEIDESGKNFFLLNEVKQRQPGDFWIGGNDLANEGVWIWQNSRDNVDFNSWHPGNPSNDGGNENCMEIHIDKVPLWNDDTCTKPEHYICETPSQSGEIIG